jgi:MFS family permease
MDAMEQDLLVANDLTPGAVESAHAQRGFWALIATQFQGAYSDNILRNLLLSMIVGMGLARSQRETFVSIVTFLFSVPFLLFSMPGGWLADRYSKRQITIWTKAMEIASMAVATVGLATHTVTLSLVALTLVATQAAYCWLRNSFLCNFTLLYSAGCTIPALRGLGTHLGRHCTARRARMA